DGQGDACMNNRPGDGIDDQPGRVSFELPEVPCGQQAHVEQEECQHAFEEVDRKRLHRRGARLSAVAHAAWGAPANESSDSSANPSRQRFRWPLPSGGGSASPAWRRRNSAARASTIVVTGAVIDSTMMISHVCSESPPPRLLKCTIDASVTIQAASVEASAGACIRRKKSDKRSNPSAASSTTLPLASSSSATATSVQGTGSMLIR